jgi:hypothetical protein
MPFVPDKQSGFVPDKPTGFVPDEPKKTTGFVPDKPVVSTFWAGVDALKSALKTSVGVVSGKPEDISKVSTGANKVVKPFYEPIPLIEKGKEKLKSAVGADKPGVLPAINRTIIDYAIPSSPVDVGMVATVSAPKIIGKIGGAIESKLIKPKVPIESPKMPISEENLRSAVEKNGGNYVGIQEFPNQEKQVMFNEPNSNSTTSLPISQVNDQNIQSKLSEVSQRFAPKVANPPAVALTPEPPYIPEGIKPPTGRVFNKVDPLIEEARKYGTAEEFVENMQSGLKDKIENIVTQNHDPNYEWGLVSLKKSVNPGTILRNSGDYLGGDYTGKRLAGTSTTGLGDIAGMDIEGAIKNHFKNGYEGNKIALVKGFNEGSGEDVGELLLSNAEVVSVFNKLDPDDLTSIWNAAHKGKIFNKPNSNSTTSLPISQFNEQNIKSKLDEVRQRFAPKEQMRPKSYPQTIKESPQTPPELTQRLGGEYAVKPNAELLARAQERIKSGADTALKDILAKPLDDESVATAGELIKHYNSKNDFDTAQMIIDTLDPKLREAGRTIQAVSLYNNLTPEGVVGFAQRRLAKVADEFPDWKPKLKIDETRAKELRTMAENIQKLPEGKSKVMALNDLNQKINSYIPSKISDQAISLWKAGLLTGLKTSGGNILANTINSAMEMVSKGLAVPADMAMSVFTGERSLVAPSVRPYLSGFQEGMSRGYKYFKTGFDPRRGSPEIKYDRVSTNFGNNPAGKVLKKYTDVVFRNMGAQDQPFYYGALRSSLDEQMKVSGINKGLSGKKLDLYVKNALEKGDIPEDIMKRAVNDAQVATFTNETQLGKIGQGIQKSGPIGQFVVPFTKTPAAVATQLINYTPAGAIKPIINGIRSAINRGTINQRELSMALGRVGSGASLLYLGKKIYDSGRMTLGMPTSTKEREQYELEGKIPNSIRVGNRNYNLNYFGPAGTLLLIGGYYQKGLNESGSITQALSQSAAGAGKSLTDQTFLQGVSGVSSALNNPSRFGEQMLTSTAGSVIPTLMGDIAKAMDEYQRVIKDKQSVVKSMGNAIKAKIPGVRESLPVRYDIFGEDLKAPAGPVGTMIDVTRSTPVRNQNDKTVQELSILSKNKETLSTPTEILPKQIVGGKEITIPTESLYNLNKKTGQEIKKTYDQMNNYPMFSRLYEKLSPEQKSIVYNEISSNIKGVNTIKYAMDNNLLDKKQALYELYKLARGDQAKMLQFFAGRYFVPLDFLKLFSQSRLIKKSITGENK